MKKLMLYEKSIQYGLSCLKYGQFETYHWFTGPMKTTFGSIVVYWWKVREILVDIFLDSVHEDII